MRAMSRYSLLEAVGRPELHARRIGVGENFGAPVLAGGLGVVAGQPVALASAPVLDLAGRCDLEAFLPAALGLQFGHFVSFAPRGTRHDPTATACLLAGPLVFQ